MKQLLIAAAVIATLAALTAAADAAEIKLSLKAVERAIRDEYFPVNSRHYLIGSL